jgi:hypothetical protein
MKRKILTQNDFTPIAKLRKKYDVFRVVDTVSKENLESVEIVNTDGVFRGFGTNTKKAFKSAKKVLKTYYKKSA